MGPHRIVSLLPAATEIVCALGLREALVGRSHECDHPPGVEALPVCTRPRLRDGSSREIDDRVRDLVGRGLSVYDVEAGTLRGLEPTAVVTQDQCEVCAASPRDLEAALEAWTGARPVLVSLHPETLGDAWRDLVRVGEALGVAERARELAEELAGRMAGVREAAGAGSEPPTVACVEWLDPLMVAGHWMPELVGVAGGRPAFGRPGGPSQRIAPEELAAADPDVVLVSPCGFDLPRTRRELAAAARSAPWRDLRAVREGRVAVADGSAFFNRPGPRLVESAEILAEILHPASWAASGEPSREGTAFERVGGGAGLLAT